MIGTTASPARSALLRLRVAWLRVVARSWSRFPAEDSSAPGDASSSTDQPVERGTIGIPAGSGATPGDLVAAAYEAHQREIHSFAVHATRDPEVAADVTHECFLKLLREAQGGRTPDNVRAWLYRVASNMIINRARHARFADAVRRTWSGGEDADVSPEWLALRAERTAELREALGRLSRDARVGLLLAANGFSGREIAATLGRTELATRTLLCRARGELRAQFAAPADSA